MHVDKHRGMILKSMTTYPPRMLVEGVKLQSINESDLSVKDLSYPELNPGCFYDISTTGILSGDCAQYQAL